MSEATQTPSSVLPERVRAALAGVAYDVAADRGGLPCLEVGRDDLHGVLERLKDRAGFAMLTLVTGVDRHPSTPRFELVHQLLSLADAGRVRVRTRLAADDAWAPTCTDLWPGAGFMERECYDMFGIRFDGHPNLRRLLMPEGYGHHPLRKDFPHHGIQPDRLYREWDRERRADWHPERS